MPNREASVKRELGQWFRLECATLHEFYGAGEADAAALAGAMLASAMAAGAPRPAAAPILWVRQDFFGVETGQLYPPGLMEFGLDPARAILVRAPDVPSALQAGLEGARCAAIGAVLIELWGESRHFDLTASRRLAWAAKVSGTTVFVARIAAQPQPSAAETRWRIAAAPSRALAANAPGYPVFSLTRLRHRGGFASGTQYLEWNRDKRRFEERAMGVVEPLPAERTPPLSGLVVPVSFDRQGAPPDRQPSFRRSG